MSIMTQNRKSSKSARPFSAEFVSVVIRINDVRYGADEIPAGEFGVQAWRLSKASGDHEVYDVIRTHRGLVECSCPSYVSTHAGTSSYCKHGRALIQLGLLPTPTLPELAPVAPVAIDNTPVAIDNTAPEPCCSPAEAEPCQGCVTVPVAELAPASADVFPPDLVDAWDAEAPPELWPDDTDADVWTADADPVPDGDDDHLLNTADDWHAPFAVAPYEPTEQDRIDSAEIFGAMEAQAHLDRSDRLTLAELADRQTDFYRSWGNATGTMFAEAMEALALKIRMTEATTPAELAARSDALDLAARETWEAIGYDSAKRECRCED